jgi:polyisoprenoid-binding protein YceI
MKKLVILGGIVVVALVAWQMMSKESAPTVADQQPNQPAATDTAPAPATTGEPQALAGSGTYTINAEQSAMNWEGKKPLLPNNYTDKGTIKLKSGSVVMQDGQIKSGSFVVDMSTIAAVSTGKNSGESMLTKHLMSDAFFDAAKFPTADFKITSVTKAEGDMMYTVAGDLTMKSITKAISFSAKIYQSGNQLKAEAKTSLDRTQWDVRYGSDKFFDNLGDKLIDNMFTVEFTLVADKQV